jgi:hypothetical protein
MKAAQGNFCLAVSALIEEYDIKPDIDDAILIAAKEVEVLEFIKERARFLGAKNKNALNISLITTSQLQVGDSGLMPQSLVEPTTMG